MNLKRTLVLVLVAIALGLWSYYGERQFDEDPMADRLANRLGSFEQSAVDTITLVTAAHTLTASRQGPNSWQIEDPVVWPADNAKWESVPRTIRTTERARSWPVSPDSFAFYGLDPPHARIILSIAGKGKDTLDVGRPTPIDSRSYLRFPSSDTVMTGSVAIRSAVTKGLFDMRDKALIVQFDPNVVQELRVERRSGPFAVINDRGRWRMTEPIDRWVNADTMNALLNELRDFRAAGFLDNPASLEPFGLDDPRAEVQITIADGARRGEVRILVGDEGRGIGDQPPGLYVMDSARKMSVLLTPPKLMKLIERNLEGYWDKHLAVFARRDVNRVVVSCPDSTFSVAQDSAHMWQMEAPHEGEAKRWAVNYLITHLDDARAERFVSGRGNLGLDPPRLTVGLYNDDRLLGNVEFGRRRGNFMYAGGLNEGDVVLVKKELFDKMPQHVTDFTEAPPPAAPAPQTGPINRGPGPAGGPPGFNIPGM